MWKKMYCDDDFIFMICYNQIAKEGLEKGELDYLLHKLLFLIKKK